MWINRTVFLSRRNETNGDRLGRFNFVFEAYLDYDLFINSTKLHIVGS